MRSKTQMICLTLASGILMASIGLAAGPRAVDSLETNPVVYKDFDRIQIERPLAADLAVMNVRIFGPDSKMLLSKRTMGESVEFLIGDELADGVYRYEIVSIFGNVDLSDRASYADGDETFLRKFGTFTVSNGVIIEDDIASGSEDQSSSSLLDQLLEKSVNLAGIVLDFMIPSAQAETFGNTYIASSNPWIAFNDSSSTACCEWEVDANGDDTTGYFRILDLIGSNNNMVMQITGTAGLKTNNNSLVIDSTGNIHWGDGGMNFNRANARLGIGTSNADADLVISSLNPEIRMWDESYNSWMFSEYNGHYYNVGFQGTSMFRVNDKAPANSLVLGVDGVGIGTVSPAADLNVVSGNTAKILVNNTTVSPPAGDQIMFQLATAAANKVRFVIGNQKAIWTFDNAGGSFQINLAGTGVNEFRVESDGDAVILNNSYAKNHINTSTRKAKTDFAPVDEVAVLEQLTALPMTTWRYKTDTADQRHLGPVAEDFKQVFGLSDGEHISTIDSSGVALTAIKGLSKVLQERSAEIAELTLANSELQKANTELSIANQALDERLTRLEKMLLQHDEVALR